VFCYVSLGAGIGVCNRQMSLMVLMLLATIYPALGRSYTDGHPVHEGKEAIMTDVSIGSLEDIWPLQAELNKRAGFDTSGLGQAISAVGGDNESPAAEQLRVTIGKALKNYIDAMASECHEMQDCLAWKHWYREAKEGKQYILQDLQNARVEAVDMLFFWVSLCQILGLSPADVYVLYGKKLGINHRRQDQDRSQAEHAGHEYENRSVV